MAKTRMQAVFDQDPDQRLLELAGLSLEFLDLVRGRLTRRVASQPLLAGIQKLLRPTIIEVLVDAFLAAEFGMLTSPRRPSSTIRIFSSAE